MAYDIDLNIKRDVRGEAITRPLSSEQQPAYLTDLNPCLRTLGSLFDHVGWRTECVLGILCFVPIAVHAYAAEDPKQAVEAIVHAGGIYNIDENDPARPVIEVMLQGPKFTDVDLAHVAAFPKLKYLPLGGSRVSDAGLAHLRHLSGLETLVLSDTRITDQGLKHLYGLKRLSSFVAVRTAVTDRGAADLRAELPELAIGYKSRE